MSRKPQLKHIRHVVWLYGIPTLVLISSAFLPLQPFVRQAMIGILLIWFQISLMFGKFSI